MNKTRILCVMFLLLLIAACVPRYSIMEPKRVTIGDTYSVEPSVAWNGMTIGKMDIWTLNGQLLDMMVFASNIQDKEPLFDNEKAPTFGKDMDVIEIAELFSDSIKVEPAWEEVKISDLRAENFGPFEGFRSGIQLVSKSGLKYKGLLAGAVIDEKLFLVYFVAVEMEYYPRYIDYFKTLLQSIQKV